MFWIFNALVEGGYTTHASGLFIFRILFGLSLIWKFSVETQRGYFSYLNPHNYLYAMLRVRHGRSVEKITLLWKSLYIGKFVGLALIISGVYFKVGCLLVILWLVLEMKIYFKYHSNYFFLITVAFLFSTAQSHLNLLTFLNSSNLTSFTHLVRSTRESILPYFIVIASTTAMYFFTALHKLNSRFISGQVVLRTLELVSANSAKRKYYDSFLVHWKDSIISFDKPIKFLMVMTLILELIILPIGLNYPPLQIVAVLLGISLHLGFLLLFPATLLHFSIVSISSYILFINPLL